MLVSVLNAQSVGKDSNIVVINVEKISRVQLAEVLDSLISSKPKVIGLDVFFWKDSLINDTSLVTVLSKTKTVVFGSRLYEHVQDNFFMNNRNSLGKFTKDEPYGFTNLVAYDSVVKSIQPRAFANFEMHYAFAVKTAFLFDSLKTQAFINRFNKEETINYKGNIEVFQVYNYKEIHSGKVNKKMLEGKIVLLGYTTGEDEDIFKTPLTNSKGMAPDMHGVVIHANIIAMILEGRYE